MPADLHLIIEHAEQLLDAHAVRDYCPIGVQVHGTATHVTTIATSVSSTRDAFERAAALGAQLLLCHHGLFWQGQSQVVDAVLRERLRTLFDAGITLAGYHLSLDAHPRIGNNALIADALALTRTGDVFAEHGGAPLAVVGEYSGNDACTFDEFLARVTRTMEGREPLALGATPQLVRRVGICSGGAASDVDEAARLGCDVYLTGEPREETDARARELGIAFLAAGHHATERFGIRALGDELAAAFDLRHEFLDAANPV